MCTLKGFPFYSSVKTRYSNPHLFHPNFVCSKDVYATVCNYIFKKKKKNLLNIQNYMTKRKPRVSAISKGE